MRDETREARQAQIEAAAYAVLEEKGYAGASMLAIARRAKASNETLYNWYGDKTGLFHALVRRNADEVRAMLGAQIAGGGDALATLGRVGPALLAVLTGERAVALNRAAAADPTGELGRAIGQEGRETIAPLIGQLLEQARAQGALAFGDLEAVREVYLGLLVGDTQIRRVIGRMEAPDEAARTARGRLALDLLGRLYAPGKRVLAGDR
ncbi:TetR/AcrR family transcriptional regulator [Rhodobacter sp. NTK016B]|uniref:TetR/AcrR family transcriptional regulator n=1 Tax=Rhodobacter sp. NTK016B TaxID=2759676 RepID=UPI001A8CB839|nr:TetR/AcrR family transcriptional regulator [Rhodobacter sp. NTK016B]MBN8294593.1 TetR/AcrR family transcriptional regulator [Rhodobacter sp. NTK016B]